MKRYSFITLAAILVMAAAFSCNTNSPKEFRTLNYHYSDSAEFASLTMDVDLPVGDEAVAKAIRTELQDVTDDILSRITSYENERFFPPFEGDRSDAEAFLDYYHDNAFELISRLSKEDADERATYSGEEFDFPSWSYEFTLNKIADTTAYVVFQSQDYIYMGGAHGGVTGRGCLTFDKKDGHLVEKMLDHDRVLEMQTILQEGLIRYYDEMGVKVEWAELKDQLFIEDGIIPLPGWEPFPSKDGLVFTYQQYEIASYAEGMPSFVVPFAEIAPFMTPDARRICGI